MWYVTLRKPATPRVSSIGQGLASAYSYGTDAWCTRIPPVLGFCNVKSRVSGGTMKPGPRSAAASSGPLRTSGACASAHLLVHDTELGRIKPQYFARGCSAARFLACLGVRALRGRAVWDLPPALDRDALGNFHVAACEAAPSAHHATLPIQRAASLPGAMHCMGLYPQKLKCMVSLRTCQSESVVIQKGASAVVGRQGALHLRVTPLKRTVFSVSWKAYPVAEHKGLRSNFHRVCAVS